MWRSLIAVAANSSPARRDRGISIPRWRRQRRVPRSIVGGHREVADGPGVSRRARGSDRYRGACPFRGDAAGGNGEYSRLRRRAGHTPPPGPSRDRTAHGAPVRVPSPARAVSVWSLVLLIVIVLTAGCTSPGLQLGPANDQQQGPPTGSRALTRPGAWPAWLWVAWCGFAPAVGPGLRHPDPARS